MRPYRNIAAESTKALLLSLLHLIRRRTGLATEEFFDQSPPVELGMRLTPSYAPRRSLTVPDRRESVRYDARVKAKEGDDERRGKLRRTMGEFRAARTLGAINRHRAPRARPPFRSTSRH
jgi:hypothetical protein